VLPVEILREAVESYGPYLQASGEMHDPVFGEPTQYGTPRPSTSGAGARRTLEFITSL
jgi:hypothetical protein